MKSKPRRTRYIRAKIEFTLVLDEEIDSNTIIAPKDVSRIDIALLAVLSGHPLVAAIAGGTTVSSDLDMRPRDKQHRLIAAKAAPKRRGGA